MKSLSATLLALLVSLAGCSSKKSTPAPAPAPKSVDKQTSAAATPITAHALWDLAQKDDSQMRKRFVVSGSVNMEEDTRIDVLVNDGDAKQLVKLFFADNKSRADAVTGSGTSAKVTATCTLSGTTPMSVRLDDCTPGA